MLSASESVSPLYSCRVFVRRQLALVPDLLGWWKPRGLALQLLFRCSQQCKCSGPVKKQRFIGSDRWRLFVCRQQLVYKAIWLELQDAVHAVDAMTVKTPQEAGLQ